MNTFMDNLINSTNYKLTENCALSHKTSKSAIMDLFALGAAFRKRSEDDCILLFKNAFEEDATLALRCLFYISDCRGGQGERRFFRICYRWLANNYPEVAMKNLELIPIYRRWDDLIYSTIDTTVEGKMFDIIKHQLALDVDCKTPSLLAKWLPSENASSKETKRVANVLRQAFQMTHKEYRKTLSVLRERINVLERLMSAGRWDEIEFDKIPSKAGLVYRNAFARRDIIAKKYEAFAQDKTTTVNADTLYPYEIVGEARKYCRQSFWGKSTITADATQRAMLDKYWENQKDVLNGKPLNAICVVDTSGSMCGSGKMAPINVAIGLGMYCAERAGGPFKNHYISFSSRPQLIKIEGVDFLDKVNRIYQTNLCQDTNLEATFHMLKKVALKADPKDIPEQIIIISDMEINYMSCEGWNREQFATGMEAIRKDWERSGLKFPKVVYWNVDARQNNFLDLGPNVSYISGASPTFFNMLLTGKTGWDLMIETICAERYQAIKA